MTTKENVPSLRLNTGQSMPSVGIGCWMGTPGEGDHVVKMVKDALSLGYRHIDTAANYGDEESVGRAIKESGIPRSDLFVTTKLASEDHGTVAAALDLSLKRLGLEYVDLYLMHWPQAIEPNGKTLQPEESPTISDTWLKMQELVASGRARAIGVSNFSIKTLKTLLNSTNTIPAVNQIEAHPSLPQHELLAFCQERDIVVTAYSPVGKNKLSNDPDALALAQKKGVTTAQILLSWGVQRGLSVIPKSIHPERLAENITLISLESGEMDILDNLHKKPGMHRSVCGFHSSELGGSAFGWTYDQLGWNMSVGGVMKS